MTASAPVLAPASDFQIAGYTVPLRALTHLAGKVNPDRLPGASWSIALLVGDRFLLIFLETDHLLLALSDAIPTSREEMPPRKAVRLSDLPGGWGAHLRWAQLRQALSRSLWEGMRACHPECRAAAAVRVADHALFSPWEA